MPDYSIFNNILKSGKLRTLPKKEDILSSQETDEMRKVIELTSAYRIPPTMDKVAAWESLQNKILREANSKTPIIKPKIVSFRSFSYAAVAVFFLLIGLYFLFKNSYTTTYKTLRGQTLTVVLPDNSEVKLNSESILKYKVFGWKKNRKVSFEGEAFFKVENKGLFVVECGKKFITVLGTSFNVYSRKDSFEVQCFSGKISVKDENSERILEVGMATKSEQNNTLSKAFNYKPSKAASWRTGEFYFDGVSLMNVFTEIERQFDVKIDVKEVDTRVYTGYFKNTNLKNTLDLVCLPMGLKYTIKGKTVSIK